MRALQQVADTATRRNAHHEAIAILRKALALLATLPESPARAQHELTLLLRLGPRLMAAQGYAVPDVGERYTRALTLAQQVGAANARNRLCIVVPCHRVVGADGKLTGYAGGLARKRALLELEAPAPAGRLF